MRYNDNNSDGQLTTSTNALAFDTVVNQRKTNNNLSNTNFVTLSYTEPLSKSFLLTTEYFLELGTSNQARYTYNPNLAGQFDQVDSLFTNDFVNERFQQRGVDRRVGAANVVDGLDDAAAEEVAPHAID